MRTQRSRLPKRPKGEVLSGKKPQRRAPVFPTTNRQVVERCRRRHRPLICALLVLAVRAGMCQRRWSILELAQHSHVPRSTISEFLSQNSVPALDMPFGLGNCLGLKEQAMVILGGFALACEVSE